MIINFKDEEQRLMEQLAKLTNTIIGTNVFHHKLPETALNIFAIRINGGTPSISGSSVTIADAGGDIVGKFKDYDKVIDFRQKVFDLFASGWRLQDGAIKCAYLADLGKIYVVDDSTENDSGEYYRIEMNLSLYISGEIHKILVDPSTGQFILDGNNNIQYEV
jgi:ribonuclease PH